MKRRSQHKRQSWVRKYSRILATILTFLINNGGNLIPKHEPGPQPRTRIIAVIGQSQTLTTSATVAVSVHRAVVESQR